MGVAGVRWERYSGVDSGGTAELEDDLDLSSLWRESLECSWPEWVAAHPGWLHLCL